MKTATWFIKTVVAVILLSAALPHRFALAVEPLLTVELASHCDKYYDEKLTEDRTFCTRYIQGFIDGAVVTDERVTQNVAKEYEQDESFTERAVRTRIGNRLERYGPSVYAEYCLGDPVPLAEVVEHVVTALENEALVAKHPLARDLVYVTLRADYPCDITD